MFTFTRTRSVFFLRPPTLQVATGIAGAGDVTKMSSFSVEESFPRALQLALQEHTARARFIVPEEYLYLTQVEIPAIDASRTHLAKSIDAVFPESLSTLAWDFEVIAERDGRATIEVSGITKDFGTLLASALADSKMRLEAVIPESYALARALPSDETVLFVHARGTGTILCLAVKRRVVSSLILDHHPSESELKEFVEFGRTRKQCAPDTLILSGVDVQPEEFSSLGLKSVSLAVPLDPIRGALLLDLASHQDALRLDLPLRSAQAAWYRRLFHF